MSVENETEIKNIIMHTGEWGTSVDNILIVINLRSIVYLIHIWSISFIYIQSI